MHPSPTATYDPAPSLTIPEVPTIGLVITALVVVSATVVVLKKTKQNDYLRCNHKFAKA
jgi:hypothetical protein